MKKKLLILSLCILLIAGLAAGLYFLNNKFSASTLVMNNDGSMTKAWSAKDGAELTLANVANDGLKLSLSQDKDTSFKFPTQDSFQIYASHLLAASPVTGDVYVLGQAGTAAYGPNPKLVYELAQFKSDGTFVKKMDMSLFHNDKTGLLLPGKMIIGKNDQIYISVTQQMPSNSTNNYIYKFDQEGNLITSLDLTPNLAANGDFALDPKNDDTLYFMSSAKPTTDSTASIRGIKMDGTSTDQILIKGTTFLSPSSTKIAVSNDKVYLGEYLTSNGTYRVMTWSKNKQGYEKQTYLAVADFEGKAKGGYGLSVSEDSKDFYLANYYGNRAAGTKSGFKAYDVDSGISYRKILSPGELQFYVLPNKKAYVLTESNDSYYSNTYYKTISLINNLRNSTATGYISGGTVEVGQIDSGQPQSDWTAISWKGEIPANTSVKACITVSDNTDQLAQNDLGLTCFDKSGVITGQKGRYARLRLTLNTKDTKVTPTLTDISLSYRAPTAELAISSVTPVDGSVFSRININGKGFGNKIGSVKLGDQTIPTESITKWSDTVIGIYMPIGARGGKWTVYPVDTDKYVSTGADYNIVQTPVITDISAENKSGKNILTINGKNFGNDLGSIRIEWQPINSNIKTNSLVQKWTDTQIVVEVPNKAIYDIGKVLVIAKNGKFGFSEDQYVNPQKTTK